MTWPTALPLVAILRGITPPEAAAHARALLAAGFDAIEVPTNSPDWAASVKVIAELVATSGSKALVGAGTVLTTDDLDALAAAGGTLAVSPHTDVALIAESVRRGFLAVPGAMTPSEVFAAARAGATAVKIFPANSLGPAHVKALRAVLPPALPLLAVGGVSPANLGDYLKAGCAGAGLGSELYRPGQAPEATAKNAAAYLAAFRAAKDAA